MYCFHWRGNTMLDIKKTAVNASLTTALIMGAIGTANAAAISSMTITSGTFFMDEVMTVRAPLTFIGPNTNLVGGYINGGANSTPAPNPNAIARLLFLGNPFNFYTADVSNIGGVPGGPVPTGDISSGVMTMNLSSWIANWNGEDSNQGSASASTDFVATVGTTIPPDLAGSASCVGTSCTFENLEWSSTILTGPFEERTVTFTLSGTATIVPVPAAVWMFGSGLLGLAGIARRRAK
jgi:hypothetical protein